MYMSPNLRPPGSDQTDFMCGAKRSGLADRPAIRQTLHPRGSIDRMSPVVDWSAAS